MRKYFDTIKRFRLKSIFFQFYLLIFTFVMLFIVTFSFYIYQIYFHNFSETHNLTLDSFLTQAVEKMDNSIYFLNDSIVSLSWENDVVNAVIVPKMDDSERNFNTTSLLQETIERSKFIDEIYLYEATTDMLFSSHGTLTQLANSPHEPVLRHLLTTDSGVSLSQVPNRYISRLITYKEDIFLVNRFITDSHGDFLGLLVAQLNQKALFSDLRKEIDHSPYALEVYTSHGDALILSNTEQKLSNSQILQQKSDYSEWTYTLTVPPYADFTLGTYLKSVLPFLMFLLIAGVLCSLLLASQAYRPIHRLLLSTESEPERTTDKPTATEQKAASEVDVLTMIYKQMQNDQKTAEAFIEHARPELEANLLMNLITGDVQDDDQIANQIAAMQSLLDLHSKYQSFIIHLAPVTESGDLINYMVFKEIQLLLKDILRPEWGHLYFLRLESTSCSFILQYDSEFSAARIKQIYQQFSSELKQHLNKFSEKLILTNGKVYQDIVNITMSYHEAKEDLRKQLYYSTEEASDTKPDTDNTTEDSVHNSYFSSQLTLFGSFLSEGEVVLAENLLTQILKELCISDSSITSVRTWCVRILDILVERNLEVRSDSSTLGKPEYQTLYQQLDQIPNQKDIYLYMVKETSRFLGTIKSELNKKQRRLISRAKEYMHQHYSDSSLSIYQIAESIGISGTYLSSIFTEYTGENLVTYLNAYRVNVAKDLLVNSQIIIKDIGFKTGFNTVQNFNRVFKKFTGMTPGDYRRQNKDI